jgi:formylglycine-generating enzyme required for sulfatase activity
MKVDMMVQRLLAVLLMVALVGSVYAGDAKEVVVSSAEELKGIKAKKITWKKDGAKMVLIPSTATLEQKKTFNRVGEPIVKAVEVEGPNPVPFYIDVTEVTVGQFKKFVKSSGYKPAEPIDWNKVYKYSPTDKHPMIYVTWHDATAYAKWVGKRLPTEAEWEFAARGGLVGKEFTWGDDESVAREYAHYGSWNDGKGTTKPVGSFKPNGYGLFDMVGNVWEWCADLYSSDHGGRVVRGGSWNDKTNILRVASRGYDFPMATNLISGFRCVSGFPAAQQ